MALELLFKAVFSIVDILRGSFFLAIIAFVAVFFASFLQKWLSKKYSLSWLKATMLTSYLAIFILIMLLYSAPAIAGYSEADQGTVPDFFQVGALGWISFIVTIILRNALVALLFTFFILPLEFFGSMVFDYLKERFKANYWLGIFGAVFAASLATAIICLFLLPWIVPGLLYLTFYWHL